MTADQRGMNMEDHYGRSGDEKELCKNGTKVAE